MAGGPTVLSATELDVLWRAQDLGELPTVITVPSPGRTHTERRAIEHDTWSALTERQLATGHGAPITRVERRLHTIGRANTAIELRGWLDGEIRAVIGRAGQSAAMLVLDGTKVLLHAATTTGLANAITSLWPPMPAGEGHSVTVTIADYTAAASEPTATGMRYALVRLGMRGMDARTLVEMADQCDGYAQFDAVVRDRSGVLHRSDRVVTARSTGQTGYLLTRTGEHITMAPADTAKIESTVDELVTELVRVHRP